MTDVITKHLDIWTSALLNKSTAGRGSNGKQEAYGIKKLRELILELAVRGKLVPQNTNDAPASELLKRMQAEKAKLVAEGKIKKDKLFPPITNEERPFDLPPGWEWVRLGDVLEMLNGRAFKPSDWIAEGLPIVRIQNLNNSEAVFNFCDEEDVDDRHIINNGSFLISWSGTPGTSFGAFVWNGGKAALNQHIFSCFQIGNSYFDKFLELSINTRLEELIAKAHGGVGLQHVTKGKLESLTLVLPSITEQHRIVAKVDELMALCDQLEHQQTDSKAAHQTLVETLLGTLTNITVRAEPFGFAQESLVEARPSTGSGRTEFEEAWQRIAEHFDTLFTTEHSIDQLKQTILQLAVMGKLVPQDPNDEPASVLLEKIAEEKGEIRSLKTLSQIGNSEELFKLPQGWEWCRLVELAKEISTGPFGTMLHKQDYVDGGIPLINPSHMIESKIVEDSSIAISKKKADELSAYKLISGDIVMARRGEMGRCALVTERESGWMCGTGSFILKFHLEVYRPYILILFKSKEVKNYLGGQSVGATMTNLNHGILNKMPIAVPPVAEQHRIVAKVDELMTLCDALKASINQAQTTQIHLADAIVGQAVA